MGITPEELFSQKDALEGRVKAGVNCEHPQSGCQKSASGYCITCGLVLCDDHDMFHLLDQFDCRSFKKLRMVRAEIERQRLESPDGKTSWDRVDDHLKQFGHLPMGDKTCERCNPTPRADGERGEKK